MKRYLVCILALLLTACADLANYNPYAALYTPTPSSTPAATVTATAAFHDGMPIGTPTPPVLCTVIVSEALNLREGPGTSYAVIGYLSPGDILEITQQAQGWDYVTTPTGAAGWVNSSFCQ